MQNLVKHFFFLSLFLPGIIFSAQATAYTWNGSTSTAWNTPSNWTPNGVPGAADHVTIGATALSPQLDGNRSLATFTLQAGSFNLAGFTLTVNGNTYLAQGTVTNGNLLLCHLNY